MRELRRLAWAVAVAAVAAGPGLAQQGGGGGGAGGGGALGGGTALPTAGGATGGTTGANQFGTTAPGGTGGTGGTGSGSQGQLGTGTQLTVIQRPPNLVITGMRASSAIATSNNVGIWYANPLYLGTWTNATNPNAVPGGFGTALYPATGAAGARGGATTLGGQGGFGAQGGRAGVAGSQGVNVADPGGQIVALPRQIAYSAVVRFDAPATPPVQVLTDIRGAVDRTPTTMLANPAAVQFQVDGRTVTLRGTVKNEDEARLVEGMVRLTPGVGLIRNELTYPGR